METSLPLSAEAPGRTAAPVRIRHVDSLRAVAAGLVMWHHFCQFLGPLAAPDPRFLGFLRAIPRAIDLGRVGVMLFFAVSGFVICRSFGGARPGAARRFLVRRFCRLYPVYWVSLLAGVYVFRLTQQTLTWPILAANVTMIPSLLGQPRLLGVYWTLEIELIFYGLCLGLFQVRSLDRRVVLAAISVALVALPRVVKFLHRALGWNVSLPPGQPTLILALAVMFWGAIFRGVYDETHGFQRGVAACPGTWLLALTALLLVDVPDPNFKWTVLGLRTGPMSTQITVAAALAIFTLWVAWLRVDQPFLTYLGVISYSLYLFHPVFKYTCAHLLSAVQATHGWVPPFWACLLAGGVFTVTLATAAYRWVERPAIALGKRWTAAPVQPLSP